MQMLEHKPVHSHKRVSHSQPKLHQLDNEVGGLGPKKVHILRAPFHCSVPLVWSSVVQRLANRIPQ